MPFQILELTWLGSSFLANHISWKLTRGNLHHSITSHNGLEIRLLLIFRLCVLIMESCKAKETSIFLINLPLEILLKICSFLMTPSFYSGYYFSESEYAYQSKQRDFPPRKRQGLVECHALYSSCRVLQTMLGSFIHDKLNLQKYNSNFQQMVDALEQKRKLRWVGAISNAQLLTRLVLNCEGIIWPTPEKHVETQYAIPWWPKYAN